MIVSTRPMTFTPRWLRALVLLFAAAVLPLGVAHAQEPDYEAVGDRLLEAVEEGELSADQAEAMMGELARSRFKQRLEALRAEEEDHDEGDWEGIVEHFEHLGMPRERFDGMCERLAKAGLSKHQFVPGVGGMLRLVQMLEASGGKIGKDGSRNMLEYFKEHDLSEKQIKLIWGMAERFAAHLRRGRGPSRAEMGKVKEKIWAAVKAGKITEEQAKQRWKAYLEHARGQSKDEDSTVGHFRKLGVEWADKIPGILTERGGLKREQVEPAMGALIRIVHELKEEGELFELDPRLRAYLTNEACLTDDQVELLVGIARRIVPAMQETKQSDARSVKGLSREEYSRAAAKIKKLVAEGKVSEEHAKIRLGEMRRAMESERRVSGVEPRFVPEEE